MKLRHWLLALTWLAALVLAAPGHAHETTPRYPIWWSAALELESLEQVEARLRRDLWLGDPEGMDLYIGGGPDGQKARALDCESLIKLSDAGYQGLGNPNIKVQLLNLAQCRAIASLGHAKPARLSHLRGLELNAVAVGVLPAIVNRQALCHQVCRSFFCQQAPRSFCQVR